MYDRLLIKLNLRKQNVNGDNLISLALCVMIIRIIGAFIVLELGGIDNIMQVLEMAGDTSGFAW